MGDVSSMHLSLEEHNLIKLRYLAQDACVINSTYKDSMVTNIHFRCQKDALVSFIKFPISYKNLEPLTIVLMVKRLPPARSKISQHIFAQWPSSSLLAAQCNICLLRFLKITLDWSRNEEGQAHFRSSPV